VVPLLLSPLIRVEGTVEEEEEEEEEEEF